MSKLRLQVLLFITTAGFVVALVGLSASGLVNTSISPVLLLLTIFATLTAFGLPIFYRNRVRYSILGWILILFMYRIGFYPGQIYQADFVWSLIIEMVSLSGIVFLAHRLSNEINTLDTIENVNRAMGLENPAIAVSAAKDQIHAEITRSRHYNRPLSLVIYDISGQIAPEGIKASQDEFYKSLVSFFTQTRVSQVVAKELRAMDLILSDRKQQRLILVCPEIDQYAVHQLVEHLDSTIQRELGLHLNSVSASFPEDGLTFDGLWDRANNALDRKEVSVQPFLIAKSERQFIKH